nr:putative ribonuclease H-like domain-containing protein [Tanacetum cinerariifolium]
MDVEIKQDDLNQKFLTSLAPEWLMYTIVWRNKDDLDSMSLVDVYNHLKVYKLEVQKKSESNSQNMAFISSSDTSSGKGKVHTASVPTASIQVSTISTDDITQIDEDDIEEMDIKWNIALLSMRADMFWKKTGKKITIQGFHVAGFDKSKVKCFNCHKMGYFARECRAPRSQDRGKRESYKQENHALVADDKAPTEFALMVKSSLSSENEVEARLVEFKEQEIKFCEKIRGPERDVEVRNNKIEYLENELEQVKKEKEGLDNKLTSFEFASKDLDNLLGSQRSDKNKEGLGYNVVPPLMLKSIHLLRKICLGQGKVVKAPACWIWRPKQNTTEQGPNCNGVSVTFKKYQYIDTQGRLNGCSWHMTCNISYLSEYEPYDRGYVSFGQGGGKITDFKLKGDTNVLLRTPKQHNKYSIDLNNIVPYKNLTCLVANASIDESMLWHRRLGHLNFKNMNKLVRNNLVRGLPSKCFKNDHTCVACLKGKKHKASCKTKLVNSVSKPLHTLHMDLFGPTLISSLNHKWYCLVVTDDFSRFAWTFFLRTKDETSSILRNFITETENLKDLKVKIIMCDNGGEFKNKELNEFCTKKMIRREFSNARTPQQNRVAERKNKTLIEAARTMLADAKLSVKVKQEKDKIGTKPDENGRRGKAWQCQSPVTVENAEKRRKYKVKGPIMKTLEVVFNQDKRQGLKVQFVQSYTTRAKTAKVLKLYAQARVVKLLV